MKRTRHLASLERALARNRMQPWHTWRTRLRERMQLYYHRDGTPYTGTPEQQTLAWARDIQENRHVALTRFEGGARLSTVWLGLDHGFPFLNHLKAYKPLIFETMFFGPGDDDQDYYQQRYTTEDEARAGHEAVLQQLLEKGLVVAGE